ncbi:MAG TPA: c-type cytochrome biogenesis protein CcsB [Bacteroidales bacterium]|nr:c-type cytochrome biogenesis protein CcsB [Bacteroidales bacterium]
MKNFKFLFSPVFMGILFVVFAASMAAATFIENDYGSAAAYNFVYDTRWFELILFLLSVNLIGQMIIFKLYKKSKITIFIFHLSFVMMIAGAAITRYTGWEGTIHIREGEEQNKCFSGDKFLVYQLVDKTGKILDQNSQKYYMGSQSADNYKKKIRYDGKEYDLILARIIPNAAEIVTESPGGAPVISFVVTDSTGREMVKLRNGESTLFRDLSIGLNPVSENDVTIITDSSSFYVKSKFPFEQSGMMTQEKQTIMPGEISRLSSMQIISVKDLKIVAQELEIAGIIKTVSLDRTKQETGRNSFIFNLISDDKQTVTITLWDNGTEYQTSGSAEIDGNTLGITYGSEEIPLPFSLKLTDFVLERYPGSNSPSGYKSNIVLIDRADNIERPFTIFMNNILKHKGYRFYQSSYDQDEMGTILAVNHDLAGMMVTYTGYGLLFLFIILSLLNRKSVFYAVNAEYWNSALRKKAFVIGIMLMFSGLISVDAQKLVASKDASEAFGNVLVQDQKGRTKPLFTLSNDILRKVTRENKFEGLTPMQVFLGVYFDFDNWKDIPMIRISNKDLRNSLNISGNMASFSDLVDLQGGGSYKLSDDVSKAYSKAPGARTKADKEIMKVDERVNILYMIYTGGFLKMFPLNGDSHNWGSPEEALKRAVSREDSIYLKNVMPLFADALQANNISTAKQIAASVKEYQKKFAGYDLPPESKSRAELLYYKLMIFERLFPFYATTGLLMLIGLIIMVIKGRKNTSLFVRILSWILFIGFLFHTFGLGIRWYVAGHSPMSNGYESMIFISWVTLLAGFIFSRKSPFALSATAVLAGMTLMVAHLSFMDPEITNLVPVLKSYWLTLHVSVITGSYGFLGLGAILAIISMILLLLSDKNNIERISGTIDELVVINYKTLTLGLYLLTIGTFLGAVWANESWGRYWGWDPKETWSLITIIIYSVVIHSRMIPGMKDIYTFNLLSLFAFSSVLMTYFGVNYYLTGMHSYAGGDPVPVPVFVYIALIVLVLLSIGAYTKYRKWQRGNETMK